jgi:hypothetical protein
MPMKAVKCSGYSLEIGRPNKKLTQKRIIYPFDIKRYIYGIPCPDVHQAAHHATQILTPGIAATDIVSIYAPTAVSSCTNKPLNSGPAVPKTTSCAL